MAGKLSKHMRTTADDDDDEDICCGSYPKELMNEENAGRSALGRIKENIR